MFPCLKHDFVFVAFYVVQSVGNYTRLTILWLAFFLHVLEKLEYKCDLRHLVCLCKPFHFGYNGIMHELEGVGQWLKTWKLSNLWKLENWWIWWSLTIQGNWIGYELGEIGQFWEIWYLLKMGKFCNPCKRTKGWI